MSDERPSVSANDPPAERKLFTIEEANASLPLVRAIVEDLARLSRDVLERRERLAAVPGSHTREGHEREGNDPYSEEMAQIQEELERDTEELKGYIDELRALGLEPKNGLEGLVDFPALMDGRVVYLCWKLGEPEVLHWHELDAGFVGRHPLVAGASTSDSALAGSGSSDVISGDRTDPSGGE